MTTITVSYAGNLRCTSTHEASGSSIDTDAPVDNHGKGERFSPTDLLAASLLTCMITVMGIRAQKMGKDFQAEGIVHKHMTSDPRRIGRLEVELNATGDAFDDKQKEILRRAAIECPVALSLHPDTIQDVLLTIS